MAVNFRDEVMWLSQGCDKNLEIAILTLQTGAALQTLNGCIHCIFEQ